MTGASKSATFVGALFAQKMLLLLLKNSARSRDFVAMVACRIQGFKVTTNGKKYSRTSVKFRFRRVWIYRLSSNPDDYKEFFCGDWQVHCGRKGHLFVKLIRRIPITMSKKYRVKDAILSLIDCI
jgi:hypothetical protein